MSPEELMTVASKISGDMSPEYLMTVLKKNSGDKSPEQLKDMYNKKSGDTFRKMSLFTKNHVSMVVLICFCKKNESFHEEPCSTLFFIRTQCFLSMYVISMIRRVNKTTLLHSTEQYISNVRYVLKCSFEMCFISLPLIVVSLEN